METITISLSPQTAETIRQWINAGRYESAEAAILAAVDSMRSADEDQKKLELLRTRFEDGLIAAERGDFVEIDGHESIVRLVAELAQKSLSATQ